MPASQTTVSIRFALPSPELSPFVTAYYCTTLEVSHGGVVEDYLHPEWANIRFVPAGMSHHAVGGGQLEPTPAFAATGPTSVATRFRMSSGRSWGIGLMPLGWAKFVEASARQFADRTVDGAREGAFRHFMPLNEALAVGDTGFDAERALIEAHMASLLDLPLEEEAKILAVNAALVDKSTTTVVELAERAGLTVRTLERLAPRAFGFGPKLLLRRQRFLRSLAHFMLDPSLKWLSAMDYQYHDQAHFVRDFRRFMGMTPRAYAALDHPLLSAAARARAAILGEAVQGLHDPTPH